MDTPDVIRRIDWPLRLIIAGRLLAGLSLLIVHLINAGSATYAVSTIVGVTMYGGWTIVWAVWAYRLRTRDLTRILTATALVDAVALCMLTAATCAPGDPYFAWYVAEAVLFALLLRRRRAWTLAGVLAISYALGTALRGAVTDPVCYLFLLVSAGSLLAIGIVVAIVLGRQEERQRKMEEQRAEMETLNDRLERSVGELRAVTEITELIHSTLEVEAVGPMLLDILEKVIDIPSASLYVIDKAKQETLFTTSSARPMGFRGYSGFEISGPSTTSEATGAFSCIELVDHESTAVILCADEGAIERLTRDDRVVLQAVASELVVAVENSRLYRLTKRLSITDELTGLHNYRFLQQRLDEELSRAKRYGKRLSFLMLDIDDFKRVNDVHGHRVGDQVLAEVGRLLKSTVREVDIVARYGGEEFSVILPETDAPGAFIVAEKIRETVSLHRFEDADGQPVVHATVCIGLASYPSHANDKESLLRAADDAVYHAKATGKDRVRAPRLRIRRGGVESPI
ncbi:MAG TPA: diguanylate cyclase [Actinobacteria bacterium]|nr:diguanylate cyclase [Actinomycetota bacterium]